MCEEADSLGVLEPNRSSAVTNRPIVTLFAEDSPPGQGSVLKNGCHGGSCRFTMLSLGFHVIAHSSRRDNVRSEKHGGRILKGFEAPSESDSTSIHPVSLTVHCDQSHDSSRAK